MLKSDQMFPKQQDVNQISVPRNPSFQKKRVCVQIVQSAFVVHLYKCTIQVCVVCVHPCECESVCVPCQGCTPFATTKHCSRSVRKLCHTSSHHQPVLSHSAPTACHRESSSLGDTRVIWGEEAFQLFNLFPNLPFTPFLPSPVLESTESVR